jgi:hypothetical protein
MEKRDKSRRGDVGFGSCGSAAVTFPGRRPKFDTPGWRFDEVEVSERTLLAAREEQERTSPASRG